MFRPFLRVLGVAFSLAVFAGCNGGSSSSPSFAPTTVPTSAPTATSVPTPTPSAAPTPQSVAVSVGAAPAVANLTVGNVGAMITFPVASPPTSVTVVESVTAPAGLPTLQGAVRVPKANVAQALAFLTFTASGTTTLSGLPAITFTVPASLASTPNLAMALYNPASGWQTPVAGNLSANGTIIAYGGTSTPLSLSAGATYALALYGSTVPTPSPSPTAAPSTSPSTAPSTSPSTAPSTSPSTAPSTSPTAGPSTSPTATAAATSTPPVGTPQNPTAIYVNGTPFQTSANFTVVSGSAVQVTGAPNTPNLTITPSNCSNVSFTTTGNGTLSLTLTPTLTGTNSVTCPVFIGDSNGNLTTFNFTVTPAVTYTLNGGAATSANATLTIGNTNQVTLTLAGGTGNYTVTPTNCANVITVTGAGATRTLTGAANAGTCTLSIGTAGSATSFGSTATTLTLNATQQLVPTVNRVVATSFYSAPNLTVMLGANGGSGNYTASKSIACGNSFALNGLTLSGVVVGFPCTITLTDAAANTFNATTTTVGGVAFAYTVGGAVPQPANPPYTYPPTLTAGQTVPIAIGTNAGAPAYNATITNAGVCGGGVTLGNTTTSSPTVTQAIAGKVCTVQITDGTNNATITFNT